MGPKFGRFVDFSSPNRRHAHKLRLRSGLRPFVFRFAQRFFFSKKKQKACGPSGFALLLAFFIILFGHFFFLKETKRQGLRPLAFGDSPILGFAQAGLRPSTPTNHIVKRPFGPRLLGHFVACGLSSWQGACSPLQPPLLFNWFCAFGASVACFAGSLVDASLRSG